MCIRDSQYPVVCSGAEIHSVKSCFQKRFPLIIRPAISFNHVSFQFPVKLNIFILIAISLDFMNLFHSFPDPVRCFPLFSVQTGKAYGFCLCTEIQTVKKRLTDLIQIPAYLPGRAPAPVHIRIIPAGTGIHCCAQDKISRKGIGSVYS